MKESSEQKNSFKNFLQSFGSLLCCPTSLQPLQWKDPFFSTESGTKYPLIKTIPWLIPEPQIALQYWLDKKKELNLYFEHRLKNIESSLQNPENSPLTTERLQKLGQALKHNQQTLMGLLSPLDRTGTNTSSRLLAPIPSHQSLTLYFKNIFRDWLWSTEENKLSFTFLKNILPSSWKPEKFLILGSGASRLAVDLHHHYKLKNTLATDFNPLLFLFTQQALAQESLSLYDFPTAPLKLTESVCEHHLHNPYPQDENFHLLFADIQQLPFKEKSFNAILTPWVIDILPTHVSFLIKKINSLLPLAGEWINFGPLGFMSSDESQRLTFEELQELVERHGFKIEKYNSDFLPYLHSPGSGQKRSENIFAFRAIKIKDVVFKNESFLPEWLTDYNLPVPFSSTIKEFQGHAKVNADILFSIDGQRSVNELTRLMCAQYKIADEEARHIIVSFLKRLAESQSRKEY